MQTIEVKRETKGDSVALGMFWIGVFLIFLLFLQGCGSSAGWRFEIGVAPVTAINNTASLGEAEQEKSK